MDLSLGCSLGQSSGNRLPPGAIFRCGTDGVDIIGLSVKTKPALATADYYVDSSALPGGDGSSATPWNRLSQISILDAAGNPAVPASSSVNIAGTFTDRLILSAAQQNIEFNFDLGAEIRGDIDISAMVAAGKMSWTASTNPSYAGYYYLKVAAPLITGGHISEQYLPHGGCEEIDRTLMLPPSTYYPEILSLSTDTRPGTLGQYSIHGKNSANARLEGIYIYVLGLTVGAKYAIKGWCKKAGSGNFGVRFNSYDAYENGTTWNEFDTGIQTVASGSVFIRFYSSSPSLEWWVDDLKIVSYDAAGVPIETSPNPWVGLIKGGSVIDGVSIDGIFEQASTKNWRANKYDFGDFDTIGFSTLYVKLATRGNADGSDPTLSPTAKIYVNISKSPVLFPVGASGNILNDVDITGSTDNAIQSAESVAINRPKYRNTATSGVSLIAGGGAIALAVNYPHAISCGHQQVLVATTANISSISIISGTTERCHLLFRMNDNSSTCTVNIYNNATKDLYAGALATFNSPNITLNEDYNQWHVNVEMAILHTSTAISWNNGGTRYWTQSAAHDIPANFNVTQSAGTETGNGDDPLIDASGYPVVGSPLISTGTLSKLSGTANIYDAAKVKIYDGLYQIPDGPAIRAADIGAFFYVVGGKYYTALTIVSGTGPADWVVKLPAAPDIIAILGLDSTWFDASAVPKEVAFSGLGDDVHIFDGNKGKVVMYSADMSADAAKIHRVIGD